VDEEREVRVLYVRNGSAGAVRVWDQHHVGSWILTETPDRRSFEQQAVGADLLVVEDLDGYRVKLLHIVRRVAESDVDELDFLFCYETKRPQRSW